MPPNSSRFCSAEPASMTGIAPSRLTSTISEQPAEIREISSMRMAKVSEPPPAPPNSSC